MANTNADVLRVEATLANVPSTIRERQNGYANDTHTIVHKYTGGSTASWTADDEDLKRTGKLTLTKTTQQLEIEYDGTHELDVTVNASGDATFAPTRHILLQPGTDGTGTLEVNGAEDDIDTIINGDDGPGLVVNGEHTVVIIGSETAQSWDTGGAYPAVLQLGPYSGIAGNGVDDLDIVLNAYYDETDTQWERSASGACARIQLEPYYVRIYGSDVSATPGTDPSWQEIIEFGWTGSEGAVFINDDGEDIDFRVESGAEQYALFLDAGNETLIINDGGSDFDFRVEGDTLTTLLYTDAGNDRLASGTATPDRALHVERDTATTDAVQYLQRLTSTCSGTVADGFGVGMEFELENSTQATNYVAATVAARWEDDGAGDSSMVFSVVESLTTVECGRFDTVYSPALYLYDEVTDDTEKYARLRSLHYDSDEIEGFSVITGYATKVVSTEFNNVYIGGGDADANAATVVSIYTAANATTRTGTLRLTVDPNGDVTIASLAGSGSRAVVADANGKLSAP